MSFIHKIRLSSKPSRRFVAAVRCFVAMSVTSAMLTGIALSTAYGQSRQVDSRSASKQAAPNSAEAQSGSTPERRASWLKPFFWSNSDDESYTASYNENKSPDGSPIARVANLRGFLKERPVPEPAQRATLSEPTPLPLSAEQPSDSVWNRGTSGKRPFYWINAFGWEESQQAVWTAPLESDENWNPPELTDAEQIEREKRELPFTQPFYWANPAPDASLPVGPDGTALDAPDLHEQLSRIPNPFHWSNDPQVALRPRTPNSPALAQRDRTPLGMFKPMLWDGLVRLGVADPSRSSPKTPSEPGGSLMLRPFRWTDRQPVIRNSPDAKSDYSRRVAFLLEENEEATGLQLAQGDESNSQSSNFASNPDEGADGVLPGPDGESELVVPEGEGLIAEAETLGREPIDNSRQFLRAQTVLLKPGEAQFDIGFQYTYADFLIPAINGSGGLELVHFRQRELATPLQVRYGLARRVQLFANVPFGWANTELTFSDFEEFENDGGIGDILFGGTFLIRQGNGECSDIVATMTATAPTGSDTFNSTGFSPAAPGLGGGTWALSGSFLCIRTYDPIVMFYGAGTRQHFARDVSGVRFQPGQEYFYQFGVGFAVNDRITLSTRFNGAYVTETKLDHQRVFGTIQEPMLVELAMTVAGQDKLVEPFVDFGLTDDSIDSRFGVTWTY